MKTFVNEKKKIELAYLDFLEKFGLNVDFKGPDKNLKDKIDKELKDSAEREGMSISTSIIRVHPEGLPRYYNLLKDLAKDVELGVKLNNDSLKEEVFVGEFPTGSFNSQVMKVPEGYIVLINSGLLSLIYQFMKIMSFSIAFASLDDNGMPIKGTIRGESELSKEDRIDAIVDLIFSYFEYKDSRFAKRYRAVGGAKGDLISTLTYYCEMFAVAHEYGHILAGHLDKPIFDFIESPVGKIEILKKSMMQEHMADLIATHIMLPNLKKFKIEEPDIHALDVACGPILYFAIDILLNYVRTDMDRHIRIPVSNHPLSHKRLEALLKYFTDNGVISVANGAMVYLKWMSDITPDVLKKVKDTIRDKVKDKSEKDWQ